MKTIDTLTPAEALQRLVDGNKRFTSGVRSIDSLLSQTKMKELALNGQRPFAIVLTCSDSRSPAEMIFDQGVGDLFVVRVAGNVIAPSLLASIEFAAANFASSTIVVLGHTQCGAISATLDHVLHPEKVLPSPHLEELVGRIRPAVESTIIRNRGKESEHKQLATIENIKRSMHLILEQSRIIEGLVKENRISVEGGLLDISSGVVSFFKE